MADRKYNLIKTTNPDAESITYQYDNQHNLTKITYPNTAEVKWIDPLGMTKTYNRTKIIGLGNSSSSRQEGVSMGTAASKREAVVRR